MFQEVEKLQYLENTTLSSDLAQGFALKALTGMQVRPWILKVHSHFFRQICLDVTCDLKIVFASENCKMS